MFEDIDITKMTHQVSRDGGRTWTTEWVLKNRNMKEYFKSTLEKLR